jgi:DNA-binding LacI/PurR family transcriptional regulator
MPSHRQLALEHGVTLGTVQQAVARLVSEGVLETQANRGLYVARDRRQSEQSSPFDTHRTGAHSQVVAAHIGIISPLATLWDETMTRRIQDPSEPLPPTIGAMERAIGECGGSTAFRDTGGHPEDQMEFTRQAVRDLLDQGIDALALVIVPDDVIVNAVLTQVDTSRIPVVLAVSERCRVPLPRVCYDGRIAALKAAQHLLSQGCPRLVFFAPFHAEWSADRLEGVRDAARLNGRSEDAVTSVQGEGVLESVYDLGEQRELASDLAVGSLPTLIGNDIPGIVAHNDHAAIGFMKAAETRGFRAGYDYLIIGFDDHSDSRNLGLSSMRPPFGDMGRECAKLLLEALTSPSNVPKQVSLHSHLVVRESSRKCINSGGNSHDIH